MKIIIEVTDFEQGGKHEKEFHPGTPYTVVHDALPFNVTLLNKTGFPNSAYAERKLYVYVKIIDLNI